MTRVLVIGAGAVGSYLAASLQAAGNEVTVMARGARLAEVRDHGICMSRDGNVTVHQVAAIATEEPLSLPDTIILCTKTPTLDGVLERLQVWRAGSPTILTTQNGVDAPDRVTAALPGAEVCASRMHGFFELSDGVVRHIGVPPSLALGAWRRSGASGAEALRRLLGDAGVPVRLSEDIRRDLWAKLVLAGPLGGVGALLDLPAGALRSDVEHRQLLQAAMEEVLAVGQGEGIALQDALVAETMAFVDSFPEQATSSLNRDLVAGRESEFDSLVAMVWRLGQQQGLSMPVHSRLMSVFAGARD